MKTRKFSRFMASGHTEDKRPSANFRAPPQGGRVTTQKHTLPLRSTDTDGRSAGTQHRHGLPRPRLLFAQWMKTPSCAAVVRGTECCRVITLPGSCQELRNWHFLRIHSTRNCRAPLSAEDTSRCRVLCKPDRDRLPERYSSVCAGKGENNNTDFEYIVF